MTIINLFEPPQSDAVIHGDLDGWRFYIAYVTGVGECPHKHRLEKQARRCMHRMRHWVEHQERRAASGRHVAEDGLEYITLVRHSPGRRPSRRPW